MASPFYMGNKFQVPSYGGYANPYQASSLGGGTPPGYQSWDRPSPTYAPQNPPAWWAQQPGWYGEAPGWANEVYNTSPYWYDIAPGWTDEMYNTSPGWANEMYETSPYWYDYAPEWSDFESSQPDWSYDLQDAPLWALGTQQAPAWTDFQEPGWTNFQAPTMPTPEWALPGGLDAARPDWLDETIGPSDPHGYRVQYPGIQDYNNSGEINMEDYTVWAKEQLGPQWARDLPGLTARPDWMNESGAGQARPDWLDETVDTTRPDWLDERFDVPSWLSGATQSLNTVPHWVTNPESYTDNEFWNRPGWLDESVDTARPGWLDETVDTTRPGWLDETVGPSDPNNYRSLYPGIQDYNNSGAINMEDYTVWAREQLGPQWTQDLPGLTARPGWLDESIDTTRPGWLNETFAPARPGWLDEEFAPARPDWLNESIDTTRPGWLDETIGPSDPGNYRSLYPGIQDYDSSGSINQSDYVTWAKEQLGPQWARDLPGLTSRPDWLDEAQTVPDWVSGAASSLNTAPDWVSNPERYAAEDFWNVPDWFGRASSGQARPGWLDESIDTARPDWLNETFAPARPEWMNEAGAGQSRPGWLDEQYGPSDPGNFRSRYPGIQDYDNSGEINMEDVVTYGREQTMIADQRARPGWLNETIDTTRPGWLDESIDTTRPGWLDEAFDLEEPSWYSDAPDWVDSLSDLYGSPEEPSWYSDAPEWMGRLEELASELGALDLAHDAPDVSGAMDTWLESQDDPFGLEQSRPDWLDESVDTARPDWLDETIGPDDPHGYRVQYPGIKDYDNSGEITMDDVIAQNRIETALDARRARPEWMNEEFAPSRPGWLDERIDVARPGWLDETIDPARPAWLDEQFAPARPDWMSETFAPARPTWLDERVDVARPGWLDETIDPARPGWLDEMAAPARPGWLDDMTAPDRPGWLNESIDTTRPGWLDETVNAGRPGWLDETIDTSRPSWLNESIDTTRPGWLDETVGPSDPGNYRSLYPGIQDYNNSGSINIEDYVVWGREQAALASQRERPAWLDESIDTTRPGWLDEQYAPARPDWLNEEFAPARPDWLNEEFAPDRPTWLDETISTPRPGWLDESNAAWLRPDWLDESVDTARPGWLDETVSTPRPGWLNDTIRTPRPSWLNETVSTPRPGWLDETIDTTRPGWLDGEVQAPSWALPGGIDAPGWVGDLQSQPAWSSQAPGWYTDSPEGWAAEAPNWYSSEPDWAYDVDYAAGQAVRSAGRAAQDRDYIDAQREQFDADVIARRQQVELERQWERNAWAGITDAFSYMQRTPDWYEEPPWYAWNFVPPQQLLLDRMGYGHGNKFLTPTYNDDGSIDMTPTGWTQQWANPGGFQYYGHPDDLGAYTTILPYGNEDDTMMGIQGAMLTPEQMRLAQVGYNTWYDPGYGTNQAWYPGMPGYPVNWDGGWGVDDPWQYGPGFMGYETFGGIPPIPNPGGW